MVRLIGALVGAGFILVLLISVITGASAYITEPPQETVEHRFHLQSEKMGLQSDGPFGTFDRAQLQRGFQVYKEVCAAFHSMNLVAFRDLEALGHSEPVVKAIVTQWARHVPSAIPDTGEADTRKATAPHKLTHTYATQHDAP